MKKTKTFQEGDPIENPMLFLDSVIWVGGYVESNESRDPADQFYYLSHKMKITVEIFEPKKQGDEGAK
jgi:hypothetical protein